ncbi:MAG: oligosaccharide flippase family protein [Flavobacteriales bacterium]|nr:oligosaccharide flippase family protein [Flavobacteriales bacterium]
MTNWLKSGLVKSVAVFTVTNFINAAIPFLLLPLLTNYLSPGDYALVAMFQILVNFTLPLVGLNTNSAIVRSYYDKDDIDDFGAYIGNVLMVLLPSTIVILLLFFLFETYIEQASAFPGGFLWVIVVLCLFQKVSELILSIWRVEQQAVKFGIFNILKTSVDVGASIFFIIMLKHSWEGRIEGQVAAAGLFAIIASGLLIKENRVKLKLNFDYMRHALKFGVPLIPHTLSSIIIAYSDRLFITHMVGLDQMGIYSVGYQIGMVISLLQNSFNQAWTPWFFEKLNEGKIEVKQKIVKITYAYIVVILVLVAVFYLFVPFIMSVFIGNQYVDAAQFILWIALGFAFNGIYKMFVGYLFYLKKTNHIAVVTIITALINIGLNYIFISDYGTIGAAYATCISFFIQVLIVWGVSLRMYKMPWFNPYGKLC